MGSPKPVVKWVQKPRASTCQSLLRAKWPIPPLDGEAMIQCEMRRQTDRQPGSHSTSATATCSALLVLDIGSSPTHGPFMRLRGLIRATQACPLASAHSVPLLGH